MERKIEKAILDWKNSVRRMPLIIKGARQTGKTYTALMAGKKYYKNTVYFNMEDSQELVSIFEKDFDTRCVEETAQNGSDDEYATAGLIVTTLCSMVTMPMVMKFVTMFI